MHPDTWRRSILAAADFVQEEGIRAWDAIDPLAGFFQPRVTREIREELRLRGRDQLTGKLLDESPKIPPSD